MFRFRLDVYLHSSDEGEILDQLGRISDRVDLLLTEAGKMAGELELLQAKVDEAVAEAADNQAKFDVVAATLTALVTRLIELQGQPQALLDLAAKLDAAKQANDSAQSSVDDELAAAQAVLNPTPTP